MRRRLAAGVQYGILVAASLLLAAGLALAQREGPGPAPAVGPPYPTLQRRAPPPPPPFVLTPQEQAQVDRVLDAWEGRGKEVRTFECPFIRWEYDAAFPGTPSKDNPNGATAIVHGTITYQAPDKGHFVAEADAKTDPKGLQREEWVCDGKAFFNFDSRSRVLTEYQLPPALQGKAIVDGPLPFLFGAEAEKLKQRYYIHIIPGNGPDEIWLEAYPRTQRGAADFQCAQLILQSKGLVPSAMQIYSPGGKNRKAYKFYNVVVNDPNPLKFLQGNPFPTSKPFGWKKVVEPAEPPAQARRVPLTGR